MGWMSGVLALVCLGVGLFHLARLVVLRTGVVGELAHAAMGLGMAAMFSPLGNPVPGPVWTVVFALGIVWFGGAVLRDRTFGDPGHHVVCSGTMLLMLAAGHGAHGHGAAGTLILVSVAALALTGYFAWHALRCADGCRRPDPAAEAAPGAARTPAGALEAPQLASAAQLVSAAAMAVMLLGMV